MTALKAVQNQPVCSIVDLVENSGVCALVNGQQVAVFYVPTATPPVYAIANWDPLGKANVLYRGILGDVEGELVVASPLYKQHFSLTSGHCLEEEGVSIAVYPVSIDGDYISIQV